MEKKLNPIESRILTVLVKNGDYMSTAEVSKEAKISWNTALLYLDKFEKMGWINKLGSGTTTYWIAVSES